MAGREADARGAAPTEPRAAPTATRGGADVTTRGHGFPRCAAHAGRRPAGLRRVRRPYPGPPRGSTPRPDSAISAGGRAPRGAGRAGGRAGAGTGRPGRTPVARTRIRSGEPRRRAHSVRRARDPSERPLARALASDETPRDWSRRSGPTLGGLRFETLRPAPPEKNDDASKGRARGPSDPRRFRSSSTVGRPDRSHLWGAEAHPLQTTNGPGPRPDPQT